MKKLFSMLFWLICLLPIQAATAQIATIADLQTAVQNATGDVELQLSPSFPATLDAAVTLGIAHDHDVIINGGSESAPLELAVTGAFRHFTVSKSNTAGSLTFKNIVFKGRRSAAEIQAEQTGTEGGGVAINSANSGLYRFDGVQFVSIGWGGQAALGFAATPVEIVNTTFENNAIGYGHGGGISGSGDLTIKHSAFIGNRCYGAGGYAGGAIGMLNYIATIDITDSVFIGNKSNIRGGAISLHNSANASLTIDRSYFEGNETTVGTTTSEGGAISIFGPNNSGTRFEVKNSTFYRNVAADDGGAIFLENRGTGASNRIVNCTLYENTARDFSDPTTTGAYASGGGAIQLSLNTTATLEHNTFYGNVSRFKGGALGVHAHATQGTPRYQLKNNIFLGNTLTEASGADLDNVAAKSWTGGGSALTDQGGNLGIDNGATVQPAGVSVEKVFGTAAPALSVNQSRIKAGNPYQSSDAARYRVIPTVAILPNDGTLDAAGMADGQGVATTLATDERGHDRIVAAPDIGAVEALWVRFDANGGKWSGFGSLQPADDEHFHADLSGDIEKYYRVAHVSATVTSPADPVNNGSVFGGWVIDDGSDTPWNPALPLAANVKVKALWLPLAAAIVHFHGNGATGGSVASMPGTLGQSVTLPANGFTHPGYTFVEWNSRADGSGVGYQPGDSFPLTIANNNLYARWVPVGQAVIRFVANGGSGTMADVTVPLGSPYALPPNGFTHSRAFLGWSTTADNSGALYQPAASFTPTRPLQVFYARWQSSRRVTYVCPYGTPLPPAEDVEPGQSYAVSATVPGRSNYQFQGWAHSHYSGTFQPSSNFTMPNADVTLYARWRPLAAGSLGLTLVPALPLPGILMLISLIGVAAGIAKKRR